MPKHSQDGRFMAVNTPLGKDALLLETLNGVESLNELFEFDLGLLAEAGTAVAFDAVLGQSVTVTFQLPNGGQRYINGIVNRFAEGAQIAGPLGGFTFARFRATVVPKLWLLTRKTNCRIFQQITVPDILKKVLAGITVSWELQGTYEPRDYCVQYRETDFAFASRLMEEEGIYYYFKHADGTHTMVVADTPQSHLAVPGPVGIRFEGAVGGVRSQDTDRVYAWVKTQEIRTGKQSLWDHCFELTQPPGFQTLEYSEKIQQTVPVGSVSHSLTAGGGGELELYDYPGGYAQRFDGVAPGGGDRPADVQKIFSDNGRTTKIRIQQEAARGVLIVGEGTVRHLTAGHKFTLKEHFNANGEYVVTRVEHNASLIGAYTREEQFDTGYRNAFHCIPFALPYRPAQVTPKARVWGTHTATVVGPAGEEIFTDKYSRVKVQFHWDREGKKDGNSSCWVRVATHWAGKTWGAIHIPRIGQEVVVAFEEGDPDRPIIVGSVYNAEQMPPYSLPANKTQFGLKSRSTLKGTTDNYNELRFEDKKGVEQIYFHAEKDFDRFVENNDTLKVGFRQGGNTPDKGNRTVEIYNNEKYVVGKPHPEGADPYDGDQTLDVWNEQKITIGYGASKCKVGTQTLKIWNNQVVTIGYGNGQNADGSQTVTIWKNRTVTLKTGDDTLTVEKGKRTTTIEKDETLTVKKGNRTTKVESGNDTHKIDKGNREVEIGMGNDTLTIKLGSRTTKINLGSDTTEAMQKITLKVGPSSIELAPSGITIKGPQIKIEGTGMLEAKAPMTQVKGDGMLILKGGLTMIN